MTFIPFGNISLWHHVHINNQIIWFHFWQTNSRLCVASRCCRHLTCPWELYVRVTFRRLQVVTENNRMFVTYVCAQNTTEWTIRLSSWNNTSWYRNSILDENHISLSSFRRWVVYFIHQPMTSGCPFQPRTCQSTVSDDVHHYRHDNQTNDDGERSTMRCTCSKIGNVL